MKLTILALTAAFIGANSIPVSANIADSQHVLEVRCIATKGDMLEITLDGRSQSPIQSTNISVIALPSGDVITKSETRPMGSGEKSTENNYSPTDRFSLFVSPYSPQTTGIQVIGDIESVSGKLNINSATTCQ